MGKEEINYVGHSNNSTSLRAIRVYSRKFAALFSNQMTSNLPRIFEQAYRDLRPRTPLPEFEVRFYRFANINCTIRLRQGRIFVRLSDLLEGAPQPVLYAILPILIAKLHRKPVDAPP